MPWAYSLLGIHLIECLTIFSKYRRLRGHLSHGSATTLLEAI